MKPSTSDRAVAYPASSKQVRIRNKQSVSPIQFDAGSDRIIRRREVQRTTGLSRSSLYRLIAAGSFPSSIQLSANAVGWLEAEVSAWITGRVAASRSGSPSPASMPAQP